MNSEYAVLRFLALNDSQYSIDAAFWANSARTSTDVHILASGVQQFSRAILASAPQLNPSWTDTLTMSLQCGISDFGVALMAPRSRPQSAKRISGPT